MDGYRSGQERLNSESHTDRNIHRTVILPNMDRKDVSFGETYYGDTKTNEETEVTTFSS